MDILWNVVLLIVGFAMLVKGADWFVDGAAGIASKLKVPQLVIGLTIVAMGTSAPEAAVSITAALKNTASIAIGNVVGSNIFNILFILGTTALITPIPYASAFIIDGIVAVATGIVLWLAVFKKLKLKRGWGIAMLVLYAAYFVYLVQL